MPMLTIYTNDHSGHFDTEVDEDQLQEFLRDFTKWRSEPNWFMLAVSDHNGMTVVDPRTISRFTISGATAKTLGFDYQALLRGG